MKSAIPPALKRTRTCPRRCAEDFVPPYGAWMANGDTRMEQAVMGYFGVQFAGSSMQEAGEAAFAAICELLGGADGARHVDKAACTDSAGYRTLVAIAYWTGPESFEAWQARADVAAWWDDPARLADGPGYFREIFSPTADRLETLFSSLGRPEGIAAALGDLDPEDVQEHSYWGSMRDRVAAAQTDRLEGPAGAIPGEARDTFGQRIRVAGPDNLAVIRSGQDWGDTGERERGLYLGDIEPVLAAGMEFLTQEGRPVGCWSNRYMRHAGAEKSFGLSYWRSLGDLEAWAESHPTHLAIFNGFLGMAGALQFQLDLRLYHEVCVLRPEQQFLEYINCHPGTGLLACG